MLALGLGVTSSLTPIDGLVRGPYSEGGLFPRLALDFDDNKYATDVGSVTFADAFTAGSPKLTYACSSTSTMVNSSGNIVTVAAGTPRVGHHVYSGSSWVNEGLFIESEARTNLITDSIPDSNWSPIRATISENVSGTVAPDGSQTASKGVESSASGTHRVDFVATLTDTNTYTYSIFAKAAERSMIAMEIGNSSVTGNFARFDLSSGSVAAESGTVTSSIENFGNGWYRCRVTAAAGTTDRILIGIFDGATQSYAGDGSSGVFLWGAQLEENPTASSHIPTSGASATRAAQTLVVPPAAFGWPEPEYIGPELVTNGGFDTDITNWTQGGGDGASLTWNNGTADIVGNGYLAQSLSGLTAGAVYQIKASVTETNSQGSIRIGTSENVGDLYDSPTFTSATDYTLYIVPAGSGLWVTLKNEGSIGDTAAYSLWDNISVREVNPLSVSIQMDGRMTFADEDQSLQHQLWNWKKDNNNLIRVNYDTHSTYGSGRISFQQVENNVYDLVNTGSNVLAPGTLVSFNIASRHGSTFTNAAVDGTALTENATPTALPDLSASDLQIATDFMGTIRTFRQFAGDIGDAGLATATS